MRSSHRIIYPTTGIKEERVQYLYFQELYCSSTMMTSKKVQFENKIEWKLGFISAPSDTVHQYKTSEDLLRLSSKFGYKAITNWYYTISAEFKTQFFSNYETNSDKMVSSWLSPSELNIGYRYGL